MADRIRIGGRGRKLREKEGGEWLVPLPADMEAMFTEALNGPKLNSSGEWCSSAFWQSVKTFLDGVLEEFKQVIQMLFLLTA